MYGSLRVPSGWNVVHHYMVHHQFPWQLMTYTETTEIEWWQILSSLVHSSLIAHCSYNLKFLMLKVIRRIASSKYCHLLGSITARSCALHMTIDSHTIPSHNTVQNNCSIDGSLWISRSFQLPIRSDDTQDTSNCCPFLGQHSLRVSRLQQCLEQWPDSFQFCSQFTESTLQL